MNKNSEINQSEEKIIGNSAQPWEVKYANQIAALDVGLFRLATAAIFSGFFMTCNNFLQLQLYRGATVADYYESEYSKFKHGVGSILVTTVTYTAAWGINSLRSPEIRKIFADGEDLTLKHTALLASELIRSLIEISFVEKPLDMLIVGGVSSAAAYIKPLVNEISIGSFKIEPYKSLDWLMGEYDHLFKSTIPCLAHRSFCALDEARAEPAGKVGDVGLHSSEL